MISLLVLGVDDDGDDDGAGAFVEFLLRLRSLSTQLRRFGVWVCWVVGDEVSLASEAEAEVEVGITGEGAWDSSA